MTAPPKLRFGETEAEAAWAAWGCNCGPAAVAAVTGLTLDEVRPHLGDFERKRYTNPTLMWAILNSLGVRYRVYRRSQDWPQFGLVRVQWEGPFTQPGAHPKARYRHTHWVGAATATRGVGIFDVNCLDSGGWVYQRDWADIIVPHILQACVPMASGGWHLTHVVEIERDDA